MATSYQGRDIQKQSEGGLRLEKLPFVDYTNYDETTGLGAVQSEINWLVADNNLYSSSVEFDKESGEAYSASYFLPTPINISGSFYGNLYGTATSASYVLSASYAPTDSSSLYNAAIFSNPYLILYKGDGSGTILDLSTLTVTSASHALTASYAANGGVTQLLAGPNVTLSPTNGYGQVTVSATLSGSTIFNTATGSYGSFYDTTTQTNPVGNVPRSMSFDSTDITNGVSISGSTSPFNTYIKTENAGVYNIQFSAQVDKTDSGNDEIVIWLRKNGIDLTDTATTLTLSGNNDKKVAAWNWFVTSAANDYYQIIWLSADTDLRLLAEPISGTHPGIPSVILTANRVDQFLSNTGSFSGSFNGSFTGSLFGTASWATNALTASYVNPLVQNVIITGSTFISSSNATQLQVGNNLLYVSGSGLIGFNQTSSLGAQATFKGVGGGPYVSEINTLTNGQYGFRTDGPVKSNGLYLYNSTGNIANSSGVSLIYFDASNNIGIGVSSSLSAKTTIRGTGTTSATTALRVENTNASASLVVRDNGSVSANGIGFISSNTAFGASAFGNNISSSAIENTAFGASVLNAIVTGTRNTGVGYNVLPFNTTGLRNTSMGAYAMTNNSVGSDNVAIGMQAMYFNTSGSSNTAVGEYSLYGNVNGSNNIGLGISSLFYLNTGSSNIAIGALSGRTLANGSTPLSSSNYSIFIGHDAKANNNGETNQIVIGYSANGIGSNSVVLGNDSVTKTALKGNVLIGTTTSSIYNLDVSGSGRFTNGLTVTGSLIAPSITGSLQGTASYATQALSASWAPSVASNPFPFTGSAIISGSLTITGSLTVTGSVISNTDGLNRLARYGTAISGSTIGTGVTAQTIVFSQLIPANTLGANDIIRTYFRFRKLATNANATYNILVNTSNAVAGATTLATLTANTVHNQMKRDFYIAQGNATTTVGSAINVATDDTTNTQLLSTITWSSDQYIIYTVTLNTADSGYGLGYTIEQVL